MLEGKSFRKMEIYVREGINTCNSTLSQSKLNWGKNLTKLLEDEKLKKIEMFLTDETIAVTLLVCSELISCYLEYYEHDMNIVKSHV